MNLAARILLYVFAGLAGLCVGSFLNVVIYRVPRGLSVVRPASACPACGAHVRPADNVPVVSWIVLRGRCRSCAAPIAARYPLVEALTAALFVVVALRFGWGADLAVETVLVAGLVACSFIDAEHMLLPRKVVYPLWLGVAVAIVAGAAASGDWRRAGVAAACGAIEGAVLFAIHAISPGSLGFGDVRFGPAIAAALGWLGWRYAFLGFLAANLVGAVVGLALMALGRASRKTPIPYGVFLSVGAVAAMVLGSSLRI